ncbi:carbohydrate sulfotransferase 2 [Striga asiatica]|uniref:Carbohydrate sulfotransferase 2 n=1 Tax=Striga asiatica TaxID=4170 RepID=A0A5A7PJA5_STRAF|nr:carbohydrate sulfotransferase 2 [Striga asiatica]
MPCRITGWEFENRTRVLRLGSLWVHGVHIERRRFHIHLSVLFGIVAMVINHTEMKRFRDTKTWTSGIEDGVSIKDETQIFKPYFESQENERESANAWRLSLTTNIWNSVRNM